MTSWILSYSDSTLDISSFLSLFVSAAHSQLTLMSMYYSCLPAFTLRGHLIHHTDGLCHVTPRHPAQPIFPRISMSCPPVARLRSLARTSFPRAIDGTRELIDCNAPSLWLSDKSGQVGRLGTLLHSPYRIHRQRCYRQVLRPHKWYVEGAFSRYSHLFVQFDLHPNHGEDLVCACLVRLHNHYSHLLHTGSLPIGSILCFVPFLRPLPTLSWAHSSRRCSQHFSY